MVNKCFAAGQDILSCGFTGAMLGGVLCASRLLNRNLWQDLLALKAKIGKADWQHIATASTKTFNFWILTIECWTMSVCV